MGEEAKEVQQEKERIDDFRDRKSEQMKYVSKYFTLFKPEGDMIFPPPTSP